MPSESDKPTRPHKDIGVVTDYLTPFPNEILLHIFQFLGLREWGALYQAYGYEFESNIRIRDILEDHDLLRRFNKNRIKAWVVYLTSARTDKEINEAYEFIHGANKYQCEAVVSGLSLTQTAMVTKKNMPFIELLIKTQSLFAHDAYEEIKKLTPIQSKGIIMGLRRQQVASDARIKYTLHFVMLWICRSKAMILNESKVPYSLERKSLWGLVCKKLLEKGYHKVKEEATKAYQLANYIIPRLRNCYEFYLVRLVHDLLKLGLSKEQLLIGSMPVDCSIFDGMAAEQKSTCINIANIYGLERREYPYMMCNNIQKYLCTQGLISSAEFRPGYHFTCPQSVKYLATISWFKGKITPDFSAQDAYLEYFGSEYAPHQIKGVREFGLSHELVSNPKFNEKVLAIATRLVKEGMISEIDIAFYTVYKLEDSHIEVLAPYAKNERSDETFDAVWIFIQGASEAKLVGMSLGLSIKQVNSIYNNPGYQGPGYPGKTSKALGEKRIEILSICVKCERWGKEALDKAYKLIGNLAGSILDDMIEALRFGLSFAQVEKLEFHVLTARNRSNWGKAISALMDQGKPLNNAFESYLALNQWQVDALIAGVSYECLMKHGSLRLYNNIQSFKSMLAEGAPPDEAYRLSVTPAESPTLPNRFKVGSSITQAKSVHKHSSYPGKTSTASDEKRADILSACAKKEKWGEEELGKASKLIGNLAEYILDDMIEALRFGLSFAQVEKLEFHVLTARNRSNWGKAISALMDQGKPLNNAFESYLALNQWQVDALIAGVSYECLMKHGSLRLYNNIHSFKSMLAEGALPDEAYRLSVTPAESSTVPNRFGEPVEREVSQEASPNGCLLS